MTRYDAGAIERRWQGLWNERGAHVPSEDGEPFYLLEMFPYPSGRIHMGHVRNYTIGDVLARFLRVRGYSVLHPMGWDAFGLPAETAAIQRGIAPAIWTRDNIDAMREQLKRMGFSYDPATEIATCDPGYYRWEQLFFVKMMEKGIAYRKKARVNWCEGCGTVLANEQVEGDQCWRGHAPVTARELDQWFLRITAYADELLSGLDELAGRWPDKVLTMQRNWIGRSEGVEIEFELPGLDRSLTVFTTRADTLFGATFVSIAPEHPLAVALARLGGRGPEASRFLEKVAARSTTERTAGKEGIFTGAYAVNPVNGDRLPVYLADFVLMDYGTGAVMAVPAHDQRDFEFARGHDLPVRVVVLRSGESLDGASLDSAMEDDGVLQGSGRFDGMESSAARRAIAADLVAKGAGREVVHYRLRDWGVSRQRYWGCPIPVVYCEGCGVVPVPESSLPVLLPTDVQVLSGGGSPLSTLQDFVRVNCPRCGRAARRETDTMDTFMESSWYFLRFTSPTLASAPFDSASLERWLPVSRYVGGVEHAVLHLLYARFFTRVLRDLGYVRISEPFESLLTQGMVIKDGAKMSKSRGNVVDPDDLVTRYGADTARLFSIFAAPPEKDLEWNDRGVEGAHRFLSRVWRITLEVAGSEPGTWSDPGASDLDEDGRRLHARVHETVMRVTRDIGERLHFNTAVAAVMELVNEIQDYRVADVVISGELVRYAVATTLQLAYPFVPHLASELWEKLTGLVSIEEAGWPRFEEEALRRSTMELVLQVNGKIRSRVEVAADLSVDEMKSLALKNERIKTYLDGRDPRRIIVVPGKLVNVVV